LTAATTIALQQQTAQTSPDKTSEQDDDGNTPKMMAADHWLFLWASEMVKQLDEFGIMAKPPPTEPTKSLGEILQNTTMVKACQVLMTNLCLQQQWHGSMPPAMVLAILNSTFVHETTEVGQFSPFAMLPAKVASTNPEDFLSLQLKSAKGKGLDATDIA
jgi:hypothetical protein